VPEGGFAPSLGRVLVHAVDATLAMSDLPITIARRYDSANQDRVGDFGHGWSLALEPRLEIDASRANLAVNWGDGRRAPFWLGLGRYSDAISSLFRPLYAPAPGGAGTLSSDGCQLLTVDDGKLICFMEAGLEYTPSTYTYTDASGRILTMNALGDPQSIVTVDGGGVTFTVDGVVGPDGAPLVELLRDGAGRIEHIVVRDGAGERSYDYLYDDAGDLRAVGPTAIEYTYDDSHRLSSLRDADGTMRAIAPGGGALEQSAASPLAAPRARCAPGFRLPDWLSGGEELGGVGGCP
jgi:YD repeat-containing protein